MESFQSSFASALLQDLLERLNSVVFTEISQSAQFDAELELKKLQGKLLNAQVLLDSCQLTPNKAWQWQHWVGDVTRVCYDVEDLMSDIIHGTNKISMIEKLLSYFTKGSMLRKIQDLHDRLEGIVVGLKLISKTQRNSQQFHSSYPVEHVCRIQQMLLPEKFLGRHQDKESIITMLLEKTKCSVCIVGMDGLGKTSLAWNVHFDTRIQDSFDHVEWVSVSSKFDLTKVVGTILHQRHDFEFINCFPERVQVLSQDLYMGKTILIVLDDIWDVKYDDWSIFHSLFLQSNGCKVLITTRNPNVAVVTKATPYYLQKMNDEDCRALVMDRALYLNSLSKRQLASLLDIAGAVAQKCKGLPLAANLLGHLLASKRGEDDWMNVSERDIYDLREFKEEIFPIFRLNNPDLASHLKKCFAYCSLFPYNYEFKRHHLVQLWMSEGFVLPQGGTCLEEIGNDYFYELIVRSIFQLTRLDDHEKATYEMHEFIHRFAELVASDTCFRMEEGNVDSTNQFCKNARHLSLLYHTVQLLVLKEIEKCEGLRTLMMLNEYGTKIGQVPYSFFLKLQRLRVLDLSRTDIVDLPESIGRLKHLQYLDVSYTNIVKLPEPICILERLQVLRMRDCFELLELPKNTKNLINLVHLDVDIKGLRSMPMNIGSLNCLQTLHAFVVGKRKGNRISELKNLRSLRGSICLTGLGNVRDGAEAKEAMLYEKQSIRRLELEWNSYSRYESIAFDILNGFEPHKNLKELQVTNYSGTRFPDWVSSSSCMLVSIHLQNCKQREFLPTLGQLPYLKTLHIEGMHDVKYVDDRFCGEGENGGPSSSFPSLESFKVQDMKSLMRWYRLAANSMQQLRDFTIEDCPSLFSMQSISHMRSLQTFEINRCPRLMSLPELPSSLESLIVVESELVKQRCQPEDGPQWCFIKVIPYVEIDFTEIISPNCSD